MLIKIFDSGPNPNIFLPRRVVSFWFYHFFLDRVGIKMVWSGNLEPIRSDFAVLIRFGHLPLKKPTYSRPSLITLNYKITDDHCDFSRVILPNAKSQFQNIVLHFYIFRITVYRSHREKHGRFRRWVVRSGGDKKQTDK